jgi:hypothetical protein
MFNTNNYKMEVLKYLRNSYLAWGHIILDLLNLIRELLFILLTPRKSDNASSTGEK